MLRDIALARELGLEGVVFGAALADGQLDRKNMQKLCSAASGLKQTLHRVFDCSPNHEAALEIAIDLGFERILTSGGVTEAKNGILKLARLKTCARERIVIMAGGGINQKNIALIAENTEIRHFHASCTSLTEPSSINTAFGFDTVQPRRTDASKITALKSTLVQTFKRS